MRSRIQLTAGMAVAALMLCQIVAHDIQATLPPNAESELAAESHMYESEAQRMDSIPLAFTENEG